MLVRMQFQNLNDEEYKLIRSFLEWLCEKIYIYLKRNANLERIEMRLDYIKKARWIHWTDDNITTSEIIEAIKESLKVRKKKETWEIYFDNRVMIPHSSIPITKLLAFIDNGDNVVKGTGMIQFIRRNFNHKQLNKWWMSYIMLKRQEFTDGKIISD